MSNPETAAKAAFPLLTENPNIVYLDSGATSQSPQTVLDKHVQHHTFCHAPVGRSLYPMAKDATEAYEAARETVANFLGISNTASLVFTSGTTMAINLVAFAWARKNLKAGDVILTTMLEHHANIVPWQILAEETGIELQYVRLTADAVLDMDEMTQKLQGGRVKLVCVGHVSNVANTLNPIRRIANMAHDHGARILVDGAQSTGHMAVNVRRLGVDFYAFSGHKMLGPMGTGGLYVHPDRFDEMGTFHSGGDMISRVTTDRGTFFKPMPTKLEAGTPNVTGAIALAAAVDFLEAYPGGLHGVEDHVKDLGIYAWEKLSQIPNIKLLGPGPGPNNASSLVSFTFDHFGCPTMRRIKDSDLATKLGDLGICVRSGVFCAQPLLEEHYGLPAGATRASFHIYNTKSDVDKLVAAIRSILEG